jgi:hypothetical protein
MFKLVGLLVGLYTAQAAMKGEVYARKGAWGETVSRDKSPRYFWVVVAVYSCLAIALATVF